MLPAAIWCEKHGTITNFEGRELPLRAVLPPRGEAREDKDNSGGGFEVKANMSDKPKIKVATAWLGGCSGCHMSFLDLDERLIELAKLVEFTASPITDVKEIPEVDVGIVEGAVCNEENEHVLRTMRARCKVLVALGDCAITGNIPALRNQFKLEDVLARGFVETESTQVGEMPGCARGAQAAEERCGPSRSS